MIRKEIWHGMRAYKATFFIKGYRQRAVAGSHLQYRKLSVVFFNKKFNQRFGIAFSLKWGNCSDILNFKYSIPFVRYDTLALHSVIIKNIHFTIIEITVNHIFLLIRQQEQIKILFFVFCNFYNSHQSHLQIPTCRSHLKTLYHAFLNFSTAYNRERPYRQHHLGMTSIRCTFPAQAMVVVPGFSTGKPSPERISFLRTVPL